MATREELIVSSAGRLRRKALSERRWANAALYTGVGILGLITFAAIFAPLIAPYAPNAQNLATPSSRPRPIT